MGEPIETSIVTKTSMESIASISSKVNGSSVKLGELHFLDLNLRGSGVDESIRISIAKSKSMAKTIAISSKVKGGELNGFSFLDLNNRGSGVDKSIRISMGGIADGGGVHILFMFSLDQFDLDSISWGFYIGYFLESPSCVLDGGLGNRRDGMDSIAMSISKTKSMVGEDGTALDGSYDGGKNNLK